MLLLLRRTFLEHLPHGPHIHNELWGPLTLKLKTRACGRLTGRHASECRKDRQPQRPPRRRTGRSGDLLPAALLAGGPPPANLGGAFPFSLLRNQNSHFQKVKTMQ